MGFQSLWLVFFSGKACCCSCIGDCCSIFNGLRKFLWGMATDLVNQVSSQAAESAPIHPQPICESDSKVIALAMIITTVGGLSFSSKLLCPEGRVYKTHEKDLVPRFLSYQQGEIHVSKTPLKGVGDNNRGEFGEPVGCASVQNIYCSGRIDRVLDGTSLCLGGGGSYSGNWLMFYVKGVFMGILVLMFIWGVNVFYSLRCAGSS